MGGAKKKQLRSKEKCKLALPKDQLKSGGMRHKCVNCDKCFPTTWELLRHERTHTGENPYECESCPKTFSQNSALTLHKRTHTGEKPYTCTICQTSFADQSNLKSHKRTHTGEKPFECTFCDYSAGRRHDVATHESTHTGEKRFNCTFCDYSANQKYVIAAHEQKRHTTYRTGEMPYQTKLQPHSISKYARNSSAKLPDGSRERPAPFKAAQSSSCESSKFLCKICEFSAGSDDDVALHMLSLHNLPVVVLQRVVSGLRSS